MVKKCEFMFIRFDRVNERDGQTDKHHMTASRGKNSKNAKTTNILRVSKTAKFNII